MLEGNRGRHVKGNIREPKKKKKSRKRAASSSEKNDEEEDGSRGESWENSQR